MFRIDGHSGSLRFLRSFALSGRARRRSVLAGRDRTLAAARSIWDRWSSAPGKAKAAPRRAAPAIRTRRHDAQATPRAARRWREPEKPKKRCAEFDKAIALDPHNAQALYSRGLLYQGEQQHQLAIDDFTAANGLTPQRAEPLLGRAISYLALDKIKEAAADLDEAAQADPQNGRSGRPAGLPMSASATRPRPPAHIAAPSPSAPGTKPREHGFARVGGKPGQNSMRSRASEQNGYRFARRERQKTGWILWSDSI